MKKVFLIINLVFISIYFTACGSFHETYKPLYQVKPIIESIRGEK